MFFFSLVFLFFEQIKKVTERLHLRGDETLKAREAKKEDVEKKKINVKRIRSSVTLGRARCIYTRVCVYV